MAKVEKNEDAAKPGLKLRIPRAALPQLRGHAALARWLDGRPSEARRVSTYFDTPDLHLLQKNISVCDSGPRAKQPSAKSLASENSATMPGSNAAARRYWEKRVLGKKLVSERVAGRLRPLFVEDVKRAIWPLKIKNSSIQFAIDVGEIKSRNRKMPICEASFELNSGSVGDIYALARELRKTVPFDLEPLSKTERGYTLAAGIAPTPHFAGKLKLPRRATVDDAFVAIGRDGLMHLRANEGCVRQTQDAEGIHQIRVAVRRLRTALSLFRGLVPERDRQNVMARLRWIGQQCAEAREWDVFQDEQLGAIRGEFAEGPLQKEFVAAVDTFRRAADRRVADALASGQYTDNVLWIGAWWEGGGWRKSASLLAAEPIRKFAAARIAKFHRRLCKQGAELEALDTAGLHELRIRAKKLRYAIGYFGELFPAKNVRAFSVALAKIQDSLGALNDSAVAHSLLGRIEAEAEGLDPITFARAADGVNGWNAQKLQSGLKRLPKLWRRFGALRPFWK